MTQSPQPGEILTSESEMLGSSPAAIPTVQADDPWAELERLARAATPGPWIDATCYGEKERTVEVWSGTEIEEVICVLDRRPFDDSDIPQEANDNQDFIAAANPATVLKLIEAARASQKGGRNE